MEMFLYGISGLLVTAIPSYAVEREKGLVWCMKVCAWSGGIHGAVAGFLNMQAAGKLEPLILALSVGFMTWLLGILMYFWVDTCKDLEKEKEERRKKDKGE